MGINEPRSWAGIAPSDPFPRPDEVERNRNEWILAPLLMEIRRRVLAAFDKPQGKLGYWVSLNGLRDLNGHTVGYDMIKAAFDITAVNLRSSGWIADLVNNQMDGIRMRINPSMNSSSVDPTPEIR